MENKPIQCPHCKSENVISTVTYRKAPVVRVFKFIFIMIFLISIAYNLCDFLIVSAQDLKAEIIPNQSEIVLNGSIVLAAFSAIIAILLEIAQQYIESKACVLHLCQNCDTSWKDSNE